MNDEFYNNNDFNIQYSIRNDFISIQIEIKCIRDIKRENNKNSKSTRTKRNENKRRS